MPAKNTRVRWSASNIPWGLSFDENTGTFSGIPSDSGEYTVPVTVETNYGKDTKDVNIIVKEKVHWEKVKVDVNLEFLQPILYHSYSNRLIVRDKSTARDYYWYKWTTNLSSWNSLDSSSVRIGSIKDISMLYGLVKPRTQACYFTGYQANARIVRSLTSSLTILTPPITPNYWCAGCYSSSSSLIFVSKDGYVVKINNNQMQEAYTRILHNTETNNNCAAWSSMSQKYCVTAKGNITAVSSDGETWTLGASPDNLLELEYRSDLGKFFARGETSKLFYVSSDGLNWEQFNNTPIPLKEVKSVAYAEPFGYCVIGVNNEGSEKYSAHSNDLENWKFKKISDEEISLTNVVYAGASINSFVAVPKSGGNYLYRLSGNQAL